MAHRRQAVRFVKNDVVIRGEKRKIKRKVRKKQRMVDEKKVRFRRLPTHVQSETLAVMGTLLAEARRSVARKLVPQQTVPGKIESRIFAAVACPRLFYPGNKRHERFTFVGREQDIGRIEMFFELSEADVIAAALHHERRNLFPEKRSDRRKIMLAELFFKRAGCRTDDDTFTGCRLESRRNQVGERLSHPGARFENRNSALIHIALHDFRIVRLGFAGLVIRNDFRKFSVFRKKLLHPRQMFSRILGRRRNIFRIKR